MRKILGIDVGSTTVKTAVLTEDGKEILYTSYERHFAQIKSCVLAELSKIAEIYAGGDIIHKRNHGAFILSFFYTCILHHGFFVSRAVH